MEEIKQQELNTDQFTNALKPKLLGVNLKKDRQGTLNKESAEAIMEIVEGKPFTVTINKEWKGRDAEGNYTYHYVILSQAGAPKKEEMEKLGLRIDYQEAIKKMQEMIEAHEYSERIKQMEHKRDMYIANPLFTMVLPELKKAGWDFVPNQNETEYVNGFQWDGVYLSYRTEYKGKHFLYKIFYGDASEKYGRKSPAKYLLSTGHSRSDLYSGKFFNVVLERLAKDIKEQKEMIERQIARKNEDDALWAEMKEAFKGLPIRKTNSTTSFAVFEEQKPEGQTWGGTKRGTTFTKRSDGFYRIDAIQGQFTEELLKEIIKVVQKAEFSY